MVQARDDEAISRQIAEKALGDQTRIARQLEADYQELAQEGRRTAANLTEAEAEAAALREALGRMNEERDRLEVRVTVAEDAAALSQQLLAEAELLQARLAAEVEALGGDTAALSEAKDAATAAKGAAEQELQDLRQQVALLRHDLDVAHGRAEEQAQALDSAAAKSRTEAATLRGELDSVERERDALVRELEEYTRKTQRQERDHAKAMVDLAEMQGRNTASSSKVVSLERQIADLTATLQQEGAAATLRRDEAAAEVAQRQATERRLMDRVAELEAAVASGNSGAESTANTLRQAQEEAARLKSGESPCPSGWENSRDAESPPPYAHTHSVIRVYRHCCTIIAATHHCAARLISTAPSCWMPCRQSCRCPKTTGSICRPTARRLRRKFGACATS